MPEFPIVDFYSLAQNETPVFSELNFNYMGYDPTCRKVIFTYNNKINDVDANMPELLTNFYNYINTQKLETKYNDVMSTLITRSGHIDNLYKNITPVNILLSNGIFILTIPREQNRFYTCPSQNIFFKPPVKPTINMSPIMFQEHIVVNRISYYLVAALCYDDIDSDAFNQSNVYFVDADHKIGTYAFIKISDGNWVEYNTNDVILTHRTNNRLERALINYHGRLNTDVEFNTWKNSNDAKNIKKEILNNKISLLDMKIENNTALNKISIDSCLLFYSENYDEYKARIEDNLSNYY
ncbi:unnamed protein product [Macrosiphum euphorbiae]|uniref:Uncharacterized protein n=1 Tax=Macrosiphum euphorbiae TaxID=13131 RepID=A0AAV0VNG6_9HEMI|nr:unnamed protein product [Macrosiphum euphorbiae]